MFFSAVSLVELIQTEVRHVQTLHIMERVFRQGMLDELQLNPGVVHALFPCLDQLTRIHAHFLDQLLLRRTSSLQSGSGHNFTIHQLGDILLEQVTCTRNTWSFIASHAAVDRRHRKNVQSDKHLTLENMRQKSETICSLTLNPLTLNLTHRSYGCL